MQDVATPPAEGDPLTVALNDPAGRTRLHNAARALLGKWCAHLSPAQRTAEAEVVVQEAITRAWERRDRLDPSRNVTIWDHRVHQQRRP